MQQLRSHYIQSLKDWNRIHRIVGAKAKSIEELIRESEQALKSLNSRPEISALLDVGAGGGILGVPWLWTRPAQSVIGLIEPDLKKSSFLIHFRSTLEDKFKNRIFVLTKRLQDVARETVDVFANPGQRVFVARAFSGEIDLVGTIKASQFAHENFLTFSERHEGKSPSFVLEPVTI